MQNTEDPKPIDEWLTQPKTRLGWLLNKAKRIQQLNGLLIDMLDDPLNQHCQVMNIHEQSITICADSGVWATQLRYQQRDLLNRLRFHRQWQFIQQIDIKVR